MPLRYYPYDRGTSLTSGGFGAVSPTAVATHASANTKSASWVDIVTSTAIDADGFWLTLLVGNANQRDYLVDLAFGGAGSEVTVLSNVPISASATTVNEVTDVYIPIPVPAGTRISGKSQSSTGGSTVYIGVTLQVGPMAKAMKCAAATTYGANTADSGGTSVDPGATPSTEGSWTQLTAATSDVMRYAIVFVGGQVNATRTDGNWLLDIGYGAASSETVLIPDIYQRMNATHDYVRPGYHAREVFLPSGTRLAARAASDITDATDRLADVIVIGFN